MASDSQSPQSKRGTAQDYEKFSKGEVKAPFRDGPDTENQGAYSLLNKSGDVKQDRGSDAVRSV